MLPRTFRFSNACTTGTAPLCAFLRPRFRCPRRQSPVPSCMPYRRSAAGWDIAAGPSSPQSSLAPGLIEDSTWLTRTFQAAPRAGPRKAMPHSTTGKRRPEQGAGPVHFFNFRAWLAPLYLTYGPTSRSRIHIPRPPSPSPTRSAAERDRVLGESREPNRTPRCPLWRRPL